MSLSSSHPESRKLAHNHAGAPPRRRNGRAHLPKGTHEVDERGFTLVEMLLSVLVLSIIIGLSTSTVRMFYTQSADVQNTFAVTNQVLLASEVLTEYTHDGVASCPAPSATPGDAACTTANGENPFAIATSTSATFFADTNDAGGTNGPVKLVVTLAGTTLTVTEAQPNASTCPLTSSPSTVCTYGTARTIATVLNETNATPLSYLIGTGSPPVPQGGSCSNASIPNPATTGNPTQISEIVGMCLDLAAQLTGGQQAGYQSLAYMLSPGYTMNAG